VRISGCGRVGARTCRGRATANRGQVDVLVLEDGVKVSAGGACVWTTPLQGQLSSRFVNGEHRGTDSTESNEKGEDLGF
jgi:hypothetical protein